MPSVICKCLGAYTPGKQTDRLVVSIHLIHLPVHLKLTGAVYKFKNSLISRRSWILNNCIVQSTVSWNSTHRQIRNKLRLSPTWVVINVTVLKMKNSADISYRQARTEIKLVYPSDILLRTLMVTSVICRRACYNPVIYCFSFSHFPLFCCRKSITSYSQQKHIFHEQRIILLCRSSLHTVKVNRIIYALKSKGRVQILYTSISFLSLKRIVYMDEKFQSSN